MKNLRILSSEVKDSGKISRGPENYHCAEIEDISKGQELEVSFELSDCGEEILLTGRIRGNVKLECSLCLEEINVPLDIKMCSAYPSTQEEIDVNNEIKELLILNFPQKPVCGADCKGICPECGANRNLRDCRCSSKIVDPRWNSLKQIFKKTE